MCITSMLSAFHFFLCLSVDTSGSSGIKDHCRSSAFILLLYFLFKICIASVVRVFLLEVLEKDVFIVMGYCMQAIGFCFDSHAGICTFFVYFLTFGYYYSSLFLERISSNALNTPEAT